MRNEKARKELIYGKSTTAEHHRRAFQLWNEVLAKPGIWQPGALAEELTSAQSRFESECGGRWVGQKIMAYTGIGQFYTFGVGLEPDGFGPRVARAIAVYEAIQDSRTSDVKGAATETATALGLFDEGGR